MMWSICWLKLVRIMKCRYRNDIECDIFEDSENCWYESYEDCLIFKNLRAINLTYNDLSTVTIPSLTKKG